MNDATHGPPLGLVEILWRFGGLWPFGLSVLCVILSAASWGYGINAELATGPEAEDSRNWATLLRTYALGAGGACLIWLLVIWRNAVEAIRARNFGVAEQAEVIEVREVREWALKVNREIEGYVLVWRDASGNRRKSLQTYSDERYVGYRPGTKIEVFRDSRNRIWWVGDVGPRQRASNVPSVSKS
ncbi:hypothetical protein [uncultured Tateyamaria sp.]|uniref:hypothetical protein n=1 Tax=uncultured Tateyamaria sp. TaxID=455651 RepID=UPI0026180CE2|nr:hypothetical protein [uncultured Tateyamaria sp.]